MSKYAELPWSMEDTIENIKNLKDYMKGTVILKNLDGRGEKDAEEIEFDFGRAIKALEEIQQYRELGTVEELRIAREKQIPKEPKHALIKHGKHTWRKDENGEVDDFAWDFGYHNGVACEVCGETVCVHCNPEYDELTDCEEEYWNCPSCGKKIYFKSKCCDCGQVINWSKEE